jgi:hypothetical protein
MTTGLMCAMRRSRCSDRLDLRQAGSPGMPARSRHLRQRFQVAEAAFGVAAGLAQGRHIDFRPIAWHALPMILVPEHHNDR